eukprot:scaffold236_cov419-Prasinococcus_capsulatus_cf.AAC.9
MHAVLKQAERVQSRAGELEKRVAPQRVRDVWADVWQHYRADRRWRLNPFATSGLPVASTGLQFSDGTCNSKRKWRVP